MSQPASSNPNRRRRTRWLTFRLSSLFVATALVAVAVAYLTRPQQKEASAIVFLNRPEKPLLEPSADAAEREAEYQRFRDEQPHLVRSPFVVAEALLDPKIAALPIFQARPDREKFISQRLQISFPSEQLMVVKFAGREDEIDQWRQVLDAIVSSYIANVEQTNQQRHSRAMSALERRLDELEAEIRQMSQELQILREGQAQEGGGSDAIQIEIDLHQAKLDRKLWLLDKLDRRLMILQVESDVEPAVSQFSRATIHAPGED